jgi:hypothetical protein
MAASTVPAHVLESCGLAKTVHALPCALSALLIAVPVFLQQCDFQSDALALMPGRYEHSYLHTLGFSPLYYGFVDIADFIEESKTVFVPPGFVVSVYTGSEFTDDSAVFTNATESICFDDLGLTGRVQSVVISKGMCACVFL